MAAPATPAASAATGNAVGTPATHDSLSEELKKKLNIKGSKGKRLLIIRSPTPLFSIVNETL